MQVQPRHANFGSSNIDESSLPEALKGRLHLEVVQERPPGETPDHLKNSGYDVKSFDRLTVMCGENKDTPVVIDCLNYLSKFVFERDGCMWYLCHTWTKTWGEGSYSNSVFINLDNGENFKTTTFSLWRGDLSISKDGKIILIDAGRTASSAR